MRLANIFNLGVKELRSLRRDPIMVVLIIYSFTLAVIMAANAMPETLHNAPIAIVDEDHSILSSRIVDAFYPPLFSPPALISWSEMDAGMDAGRYTFALDIPPDFQRDVLAGHPAPGSAQYRCHSNDPGLYRQLVCANHRQRRG